MRVKVEEKLMRMASMFVGQKLKNVVLKEYKINKKEILAIELLFSDKGTLNTMVLVLDKSLTEGDWKEVAEKILNNE